jgi:hypothetical protein
LNGPLNSATQTIFNKQTVSHQVRTSPGLFNPTMAHLTGIKAKKRVTLSRGATRTTRNHETDTSAAIQLIELQCQRAPHRN